MSAYFVVRAIVEDPVAFQAYASRSPGVIANFGGRHIVRGGKVLTFESPQERRRIVIAESPISIRLKDVIGRKPIRRSSPFVQAAPLSSSSWSMACFPGPPPSSSSWKKIQG
jgi:uncharacterized protein (DUF1330 family)